MKGKEWTKYSYPKANLAEMFRKLDLAIIRETKIITVSICVMGKVKTIKTNNINTQDILSTSIIKNNKQIRNK